MFRRFSRWSTKGALWRILEVMSDDPDFEYLIDNFTIVRAHQHAAGAKKGGLKIKRKIKRSGCRRGGREHQRYIWPFEAWGVPCASRSPQVRRAMLRKPAH